MGNRETLPLNIQSLKEGTWVEAGQDQQNALFSNVNPYRRRLLANIMTHELIEQYQLNFITEEDYNSYISQLAYRQVKHNHYNSNTASTSQQSFVFPIRYFVNKSRNQMCTTIHTGYLYADKVDLRLKQINDIPFQDLLYIYKATIQGFKVLYQKVGYFDIVEQMIFITKNGEVKVWMNANLAKNYPNYDKNSTNLTNQNMYSQSQHENLYGSQADMIRKLILLIEKNSDEYDQQTAQTQHQLFSEFLENKNLFDKLSFQHTLQEFQNYLNQNNFHCPHMMKSIPELFSPVENNNSNSLPPNYEQSHVNQITTQHLNQIKKTFHPMETIPEDQKYISQTHKTVENQQTLMQKFLQSQVGAYRIPPHLTNQNNFISPPNRNFPNNPKFQTISSHEKTTNQRPYVLLDQSRYSQQPQIQSYDHDNFQKLSNSTNYLVSQKVQKPNSVNTYQRHNPGINQNFIVSPYQPHPHPPKFIVQTPFITHANPVQQRIDTFDNRNLHFINHQKISPFQQQTPILNQKPNFVMMPPLNPKPNPIQNTNSLPNQQQYQKINEKNMNEGRGFFTYENENRYKTEQKSQNQQKSIKNSGIRNQQQFQSNNLLRESKKSVNQTESKSTIKYFTTKDSYQLDDQIANDLQKFLGLKVN